MPRKETGHERHERLKAAGICTACGKRKAMKKPESKGGGHYIECRRCQDYYLAWGRKQAKKA